MVLWDYSKFSARLGVGWPHFNERETFIGIFFRTFKFLYCKVVYSTTTRTKLHNLHKYEPLIKKIDVETNLFHKLVLSYEFLSIMFGEDIRQILYLLVKILYQVRKRGIFGTRRRRSSENY